MAHRTYNAEGYDALRFQSYERALRRMEEEMKVSDSALLDLLSVRVIITATGNDKSPWRVRLNPDALPRAFTCEDIAAWREWKGNVALRDEINRVTLEANLSQPSTVVLTDVNYPGWRVSLNGRVEMPVSSSFVRSVQGECGVNRVQFVYRPTTFLVGAFITLFAVGVVVALFVEKRK
jgi:hypothetical protein